jgi:uncharacterized membrane protein
MKTKNFPVLKILIVLAVAIAIILVFAMGGMVFLHAGMMAVVHFIIGK